jgi:hypothetical protein
MFSMGERATHCASGRDADSVSGGVASAGAAAAQSESGKGISVDRDHFGVLEDKEDEAES